MLLARDSLQGKGNTQIKSEGWKNILHENQNDNKVGVEILISNKIDFKTKSIKKDKKGHYKMIKRSIQENDITLVSTYTSNIGTLKYLKQILQR